jgi:hypothetical protein
MAAFVQAMAEKTQLYPNTTHTIYSFTSEIYGPQNRAAIIIMR